MRRFTLQNAIDFLKGNCYIVFFAVITLASEAWWYSFVLTWKGYALVAFLNVAFFAMLYVFRAPFMQFNYWLKELPNLTCEQIKKICAEREIEIAVLDKGYNNQHIGFVYLEDMVEMKLKC